MAKDFKLVNCSPEQGFRKNVEMARSSSNLVRSQRQARRSENFCDCFKDLQLITFPTLTSTDSYRCDSYCLARVFQNLPAPPKHQGVFDIFCDFQSFFQLENLGSHLAVCPDDRFLPQGKQIFQKVCQVRPMPQLVCLQLYN